MNRYLTREEIISNFEQPEGKSFWYNLQITPQLLRAMIDAIWVADDGSARQFAGLTTDNDNNVRFFVKSLPEKYVVVK